MDITTVTYRRNGEPRKVEVSRYLDEPDKDGCTMVVYADFVGPA